MFACTILLSLIICCCFSTLRGECGCKDSTDCYLKKGVNDTRKEIFAFIPFSLSSYGYSIVLSQSVTTLAVYGIPSLPFDDESEEDHWWNDILCPAHKAGVRVVSLSSISVSYLGNASAEQEWVDDTLKDVKKLYLDGVNFDTEDPIQDPSIAFRYTEVVSLTRTMLMEHDPRSQTTVDVAWSPDCIDLRCYDYTGLMSVSDFVFVMAYDMRSQIKTGPCVAGPNDNITRVEDGLEEYLSLLDDPNKLVLGSPWYGYDYPCLQPPTTAKDPCPIKKVPFRGVDCSDAAGTEINYYVILDLISKNMTDPKPYWDDSAKVYYFNYEDQETQQAHQVWFDDPLSLSYKYHLAKRLGLRGVGMWQAAAIDYHDPEQVKGMWGAIDEFLKF